ncbi:L,D-transpeptidase [bacterium]|nr:L,D-transpeptidase [bacterium]
MEYTINKKIFSILLLLLLVITFSIPARANNLPDFDKDGVPDYDEKEVYFTDYENSDTDGDGYSDFVELINGYSPHNPESVKLEDNDQDLDGLSDRMELNFKTNLIDKDTDQDGYEDGDEINNGYSPTEPGQIKLEKRIEINTGTQVLGYFLGGVKMGEFQVSSGKPSMPTPEGHYYIINKHPKAWSPYGLWMPYWMGLGTGRFGLHQLPIWPDGYREGEDHLGQPVSHGCVRLGIEESEFLYNWAEIGTPVFIY